MKRQSILVVAGMLILFGIVNTATSDMIRGIDMDFVTIDNAGNTADSTGYGAVGYVYSIGKYEVTNAQWNAFTAAAGAPIGSPTNAYDEGAYYVDAQQPTNNVSWYEALQFCNYLTSGDKSQGAYQFSGDNSDPDNFLGINRNAALAVYGTVYVLPTEDEWYKAAYYKPDGSGYSLYANGLGAVPSPDNGWNYAGGSYNAPWNTGTGTEEQNDTFDMMGNVLEWNEPIIGLDRAIRGGSFNNIASDLSSSYRITYNPHNEWSDLGFRVVEIVPVPGAVLLSSIGLGFAGLKLRRRKEL